MIRRALTILLILVSSGCTESVMGYKAESTGEELATLDVEAGAGTAYLLMDFDQASSPTEQSATDAHSLDSAIADVVRTAHDASAGDYEHGHVFVVYGHLPGETDLDVFHDGHHAGSIHVRVTENRRNN